MVSIQIPLLFPVFLDRTLLSYSLMQHFLCQTSGFALFILGESFVAVSGNNSSNVDIVINFFLSASVRSAFPGRTLTAVLNPASKAAFASARKTHRKRTPSLKMNNSSAIKYCQSLNELSGLVICRNVRSFTYCQYPVFNLSYAY